MPHWAAFNTNTSCNITTIFIAIKRSCVDAKSLPSKEKKTNKKQYVSNTQQKTTKHTITLCIHRMGRRWQQNAVERRNVAEDIALHRIGLITATRSVAAGSRRQRILNKVGKLLF